MAPAEEAAGPRFELGGARGVGDAEVGAAVEPDDDERHEQPRPAGEQPPGEAGRDRLLVDDGKLLFAYDVASAFEQIDVLANGRASDDAGDGARMTPQVSDDGR